jgi:hypothetical protein
MTDKLAEAIKAWLDEPINKHGTPFVSHPEDFTPAEQKEFLDLVRQDRFVSRDEQVTKLKEIIQNRRPVVNEGSSGRLELRVKPTPMWTSRSRKMW